MSGRTSTTPPYNMSVLGGAYSAGQYMRGLRGLGGWLDGCVEGMGGIVVKEEHDVGTHLKDSTYSRSVLHWACVLRRTQQVSGMRGWVDWLDWVGWEDGLTGG